MLSGQKWSTLKKRKLEKLAWGFLRPVGINTFHENSMNIQLYFHQYNFGDNLSNVYQDIPNVYFDFLLFNKKTYNDDFLMIDVKYEQVDYEANENNLEFKDDFDENKSNLENDISKTEELTKEQILHKEKLLSIKYDKFQGSALPDTLFDKFSSGFFGCSFLKFSPDGEFLACSITDKNNFSFIKIYSIASKSVYCQFFYHVGLIHEVDWSASSKYLISCSSDKSLKLFKLPKFNDAQIDLFASIEQNNVMTVQQGSFVYCCKFIKLENNKEESNGILTVGSGTKDGYFMITKLTLSSKTSEDIVKIIIPYSDHFVNSFTYFEKSIFLGLSNGFFIHYILEKQFEVFKMTEKWKFEDNECEGDVVNAIHYIAELEAILIQNRDNCIRMVDESSKKIINRYFKGKFNEFNIKCFKSEDAKYLLTGNEDGYLRIWDTISAELVTSKIDYKINGVAFSGDWNPVYNMISVAGFGSEYPIAIYTQLPSTFN